MKLYTKEQVKSMLRHMDILSEDGISFYINELKPIELLSDGEVINKANSVYPRSDGGWVLRMLDKRNGFNNGAKWAIEQIKKQSNEN